MRSSSLSKVHSSGAIVSLSPGGRGLGWGGLIVQDIHLLDGSSVVSGHPCSETDASHLGPVSDSGPSGRYVSSFREQASRNTTPASRVTPSRSVIASLYAIHGHSVIPAKAGIQIVL